MLALRTVAMPKARYARGELRVAATTYRYPWRTLEALCTFANAQRFRTLLADRRQSVAGAPTPAVVTLRSPVSGRAVTLRTGHL